MNPQRSTEPGIAQPEKHQLESLTFKKKKTPRQFEDIRDKLNFPCNEELLLTTEQTLLMSTTVRCIHITMIRLSPREHNIRIRIRLKVTQQPTKALTSRRFFKQLQQGNINIYNASALPLDRSN